MGQALVAFIVQTGIELVQLGLECCREPQIPKRIVKSTVDLEFWNGVVDEMFNDGKYTPSRLRVLESYTTATCTHLKRTERYEIADDIRSAHDEWKRTIKHNTP